MDPWSDLPNLGMTFGGGFNGGIVQDSAVTRLMSDIDDASDMKSVDGFMEGYGLSSSLLHDKDSSSLSNGSILLTVNDMQLDGESNIFGHHDDDNDKFMDYDWANIEEFGDLDKMFTNDDFLFGSEMIDNANFLTASKDLIINTSRSIPVPDLLVSGGEGAYSYQLREQPILKANLFQKGKTESPNHALRTRKNDGEKVRSSQGLNNSWCNKDQRRSSHSSSSNPIHMLQSQSIEQPSSSNHFMFTDYGNPAYEFHGLPLQPQSCTGKNQQQSAYSDSSKHRKEAEATSKPVSMTPQEKIEKLRRRQQMQAMVAIQKQREQYNHQISGSDITEHSQKLPSSDTSSLSDQEQSQIISSSLECHSAEESIYYQLQDAMGKLDMDVRLSIRDSLYRLGMSAMERQNIRDGSSTNMYSREDEEIFADGESNKDRYSRLPDSEAVTNPIDRIVAHLLFHNPSGSAFMPIADGDVSMPAFIWP